MVWDNIIYTQYVCQDWVLSKSASPSVEFYWFPQPWGYPWRSGAVCEELSKMVKIIQRRSRWPPAPSDLVWVAIARAMATHTRSGGAGGHLFRTWVISIFPAESSEMDPQCQGYTQGRRNQDIYTKRNVKVNQPAARSALWDTSLTVFSWNNGSALMVVNGGSTLMVVNGGSTLMVVS